MGKHDALRGSKMSFHLSLWVVTTKRRKRGKIQNCLEWKFFLLQSTTLREGEKSRATTIKKCYSKWQSFFFFPELLVFQHGKTINQFLEKKRGWWLGSGWSTWQFSLSSSTKPKFSVSCLTDRISQIFFSTVLFFWQCVEKWRLNV